MPTLKQRCAPSAAWWDPWAFSWCFFLETWHAIVAIALLYGLMLLGTVTVGLFMHFRDMFRARSAKP